MEQIRLNKYLSQQGICSRREADRRIEAGEVTVDGRIATMGEKITGKEHICYCGKPVKGPDGKTFPEPVLLVVYKPCGVDLSSGKAGQGFRRTAPYDQPRRFGQQNHSCRKPSRERIFGDSGPALYQGFYPEYGTRCGVKRFGRENPTLHGRALGRADVSDCPHPGTEPADSPDVRDIGIFCGFFKTSPHYEYWIGKTKARRLSHSYARRVKSPLGEP